MPNGSGLLGNQSSEQSSLFVPKPGSNSLYYLFTTGGFSINRFCYNVIDLNLNAGLGDITDAKNVLLFNSATEGLGGTMHCNAKDYWVVSRQQHTDTLQFYAYLLDSSGLSNPVISTFYLDNPWWNQYGFIKFSQDGSIMCYTSFGNPICVFDFDTQSGVLALKDSISHYPNELPYSNEISPDKSRIYITSWTANGNCYLSQFDLTATNITASRVNLDSVDFSNGSPDGYGFIGELQIAPDQKIYCSRWKQTPPLVNPNTFWTLDSLDVIHNPNGLGTSSNFQRNAIYLNQKPTEHSLPNFISNFTSPLSPANNCPAYVMVNATPNIDIGIFPNPFSDRATLSFPAVSDKATFTLYNTSGQLIKTVDNISGGQLTIYRDSLEKGLYYFMLRTKDNIIATGKLLTK